MRKHRFSSIFRTRRRLQTPRPPSAENAGIKVVTPTKKTKPRYHENIHRQRHDLASGAIGDLVGIGRNVVARTGRFTDSGRPEYDFPFGERPRNPDAHFAAFADPRQLHPRHRSRYDHPAFDRTRRRLLHRRVPRPAVGIQLLDQQSDARTRHGAFGLSRQHRLASLISGLHTAGRFARPLAVPASAAFDARTGRQRPDAQQNDRSPEARPTHGALLFHHLRRTDDHLLRRVSGRRISSAQSLFGCADFALLPRNHGSGTDSRPHHRNLQRLYERRRHCHDRRRVVLLRNFPGPRDAGRRSVAGGIRLRTDAAAHLRQDRHHRSATRGDAGTVVRHGGQLPGHHALPLPHRHLHPSHRTARRPRALPAQRHADRRTRPVGFPPPRRLHARSGRLLLQAIVKRTDDFQRKALSLRATNPCKESNHGEKPRLHNMRNLLETARRHR